MPEAQPGSDVHLPFLFLPMCAGCSQLGCIRAFFPVGAGSALPQALGTPVFFLSLLPHLSNSEGWCCPHSVCLKLFCPLRQGQRRWARLQTWSLGGQSAGSCPYSHQPMGFAENAVVIKPSELSKNMANLLAAFLPQYLDRVRWFPGHRELLNSEFL